MCRKPLRVLGDISFAIYTLHFGLLTYYSWAKHGSGYWSISSARRSRSVSGWDALVIFPLLLALSAAAFYWIEEPSHRMLQRRLTSRASRTSRTGPVSSVVCAAAASASIELTHPHPHPHPLDHPSGVPTHVTPTSCGGGDSIAQQVSFSPELLKSGAASSSSSTEHCAEPCVQLADVVPSACGHGATVAVAVPVVTVHAVSMNMED